MNALWIIALVALAVVIAAAAFVGWCDGRRAARIERRCGARKEAA